jgi:anaerobic magnesium-protoporphyrin IX monomethyl ester cyclase
MSCGHPGGSEEAITNIRDWLIRSAVDDFDCTVITTDPGTPYYDVAVPHPSLSEVWTYTHPKTGDRLLRARGRLHSVRGLLQRRSTI